MKEKANHKKFIEDKGLQIIFDNSSLEALKNRLLICQVQKETKKRKAQKGTEPPTPQTPFSP